MSKLGFLLFALLLTTGCESVWVVPPDTDKRSTPEVTVTVTPRKATFTLTEPVYCDVVVANRTDNSVTIPFLYDCTIEIDGSRYTQFPKPHLYDKDGKVVAGKVYEPQTEALHGTLTLGGGLNTLDAETGSVPLTLVAGRHSLMLSCGVYRSNRVEFILKE